MSRRTITLAAVSTMTALSLIALPAATASAAAPTAPSGAIAGDQMEAAATASLTEDFTNGTTHLLELQSTYIQGHWSAEPPLYIGSKATASWVGKGDGVVRWNATYKIVGTDLYVAFNSEVPLVGYNAASGRIQDSAGKQVSTDLFSVKASVSKGWHATAKHTLAPKTS